MSSENLVTVYNPSLATLLLAAETDKGSPLSEREVLGIRDSATVLKLPAETAAQMEKQRGHKDIDPENCWTEWQELRKRV
jgi:hypothetical protein